MCDQNQANQGGGDSGCMAEGQQQQNFGGPSGDSNQSNCRKLGEYNPCENPCQRIPGLHPFCPPGQVIGILPKGYISNPFPRPVQKPYAGPPPRHPWKQCIENNLINDQVRRPLARWCHMRQLPPVVVPLSEIERIKDKITARERLKAECEAAACDRERRRQESYQRHSEWNHTVDSLLTRKKCEEEEKERQLDNEFFTVSKRLKENRDKTSAEAMARAKQQLMFKNGLIRDFHAALAYSKTMKETQDLAKNKNKNQRDVCKFKDPKCEDPCQARMMLENDYIDYSVKKEVKKKECSPELLQLLKSDENRVPERQAEMEREKAKLKQLRVENPLPLPEVYVKYIQEPKCEEGNEDCKKKLSDKQTALANEIHDHEENNAFIEFHEKEVERQACEYNQYKRKVDRLRKQKEKQLIDEKVARNIRNSEKAAAALVEMKAKQKTRTDEYSQLKDKWELEHREFAEREKKWRETLIERAAADFVKRKDVACCKRTELDPTREWEKEQCNAAQNYERECEIANVKREKAKELAKYHLEQLAEKVEREEAVRGINAAWGEKAKMNYACEMREMKKYAMDQIEEWKAKGRPTFPMTRAMKKWDYEYGMNPFLYDQTKCTDETCPPYQSTAERLGFCNGGT